MASNVPRISVLAAGACLALGCGLTADGDAVEDGGTAIDTGLSIGDSGVADTTTHTDGPGPDSSADSACSSGCADAADDDAKDDVGTEGGPSDTGSIAEAGPEAAAPDSAVADSTTADTTTVPDATVVEVFDYTPSNFNPALYTSDVPGTATTLGCAVTYVSGGTGGPLTWCSQPGPYAVISVPQSGGPSVDILVFSDLTIPVGMTLTLQGTNPVILAVYGDATVAGTIDASGGSGAQGPTNNQGMGQLGVPGAGGNAPGCGSSAGHANTGAERTGGGGGGLAQGGGTGGATGSDQGGTGGAARGMTDAKPLLAGCAGGNSGTECEATGGAGGGAVQISAAGSLTLTSTSVIATNGGAGGTGRTEGGGSSNCNTGSNSGTGGGGGGSAGDIVLEGHNAMLLGSVTATGGAGGASGGNSGAGAGGTRVFNGASGTSPTSASSNGGNNGGSGGGGAGGYVQLNAQ